MHKRFQPAGKIIIYSVPRSLPENPDLIYTERRSLHYFRCRAAFQMTSPFQSKLWIDCIFQLAERHDFVMSALVALSSMHESYTQPPDLRERFRSRTIYHYNKAMRHVSQVTQSEQSIYAVLVSSILFYSLESLRGCFHTALQHVQSGVKIMGQQHLITLQHSRQPSLLAASLENHFLALQIQVMELGSPGRSRAYDAVQGFDASISNQFRSVEDALYYIHVIYNECHCVIDYCEDLCRSACGSEDAFPMDIKPWYERILGKFNQWSIAFNSLQATLNVEGGRYRQASLILRIYQSLLRVFLRNVTIGDGFDGFNPDIALVLELAETFLQNEGGGSDKSQPTFTLSMGVIPPLFMLAHRCNYAPSRNKSLALLSSRRRREGIWDSATALQLAQRVVTLKSHLAVMGSSSHVQVSNINSASETTCQIELDIMAPTAVSSGAWFVVGNTTGKRKLVEVVQLNAPQLLQ
jgi:hypothetical protein